MWLSKLTLFVCCLIQKCSLVTPEDYRKLRPINDMSFRLLNVKLNLQFRYRGGDLQYYAQKIILAQAVDGSISHIPVRSPRFFGRYTFIRRLAKDTEGQDVWHKYDLKQQYFSNLYILDYEDQFFPQEPILIELRGSKILRDRGLTGMQGRSYWDRNTQKWEFYVFTNMYPNNVHEAIPFVNDWRTNIELKVSIATSVGYHVISSGVDKKGGLSIFNRTCLSDMVFVIINSVQTNDHKMLKFSAKVGHKNSYPVSMREFEAKAVQLFPSYTLFLSINLTAITTNVHLMTLPALNVRPMVLGSQMCLFDQDWIVTQGSNFGFYLAKCFIHQYFCNTLLPYSPPIRFISDGLFAYYTIVSLKSGNEGYDRLLSLCNQVMVDEDKGSTSRMLFKSYLEEFPHDQRRSNKGAYLMHMIRSHFDVEAEFDKTIFKFMESFRNTTFSYNDFTFSFWTSYKHLQLKTYEEFRLFFNSWTSSTGYPLLTIEQELGKLRITTTLTGNARPGTKLSFPMHVLFMDRNGEMTKRLLWLNSDQEVKIDYDEKAHPYYFLNPYRNTPARVMYPIEMWEKIYSSSQLIPFRIRAVLLNDAYYFFANGQLDYNIMFQFLRWLKDEKRVHLWIAMEPVIMDMNRRWLFTKFHLPLQVIVKEFIKGFYKSRDEHNSSLAVKFGCWAQLPECLEEAQQRLMEFISGPEITAMHLDTTLCAGMRRIPSKAFQHMIALGKRITAKRDMLLMAMCCAERHFDIELFLRSIFTRGEFSISTDMKYLLLLNVFMSSPSGAEVAWRFIDRKHELLFRLFGRGRFQELSMFLSGYLKRKSQYRALKGIFEKFELWEGNVFQAMLENRLKVEKDKKDKYNYLTRVILENAHL